MTKNQSSAIKDLSHNNNNNTISICCLGN